MAEEAIIKRLNKAKNVAMQSLKDNQDKRHRIVPSDNSEFCFLAVRKKEIRMIRVVVDEITANDIKIVREFDPPGICTKEIWCRKKGEKKFEIREVE